MIKRGSVLNIDIAVLDAVLFSYFWLDIQSVKEYLMHTEKMRNAVFSENIDIKPMLDLNYAYNPNPKRATFYSVSENVTIMFPNLQDGWITRFYSIADKLKAKACYMKIMDYRKFPDDSSNYLIHIENSQKRIVYTLKENKWVFFEQGCPLPFENTAYYAAKQKKERLSKKIMLEYSESLGVAKNGIITVNDDRAFSYELYW